MVDGWMGKWLIAFGKAGKRASEREYKNKKMQYAWMDGWRLGMEIEIERYLKCHCCCFFSPLLFVLLHGFDHLCGFRLVRLGWLVGKLAGCIYLCIDVYTDHTSSADLR